MGFLCRIHRFAESMLWSSSFNDFRVNSDGWVFIEQMSFETWTAKTLIFFFKHLKEWGQLLILFHFLKVSFEKIELRFMKFSIRRIKSFEEEGLIPPILWFFCYYVMIQTSSMNLVILERRSGLGGTHCFFYFWIISRGQSVKNLK